MRLSEKTIELNVCAQISRALPGGAFWFGLTQDQEKRAGFDACARIGGRLVIIQFKASDYVLRSGARRFTLQHHQLTALQRQVRSRQRSVFYLFPLLGTTGDLTKGADLLARSCLLDVARVPVLAPPTTRKGSLRKHGIHYADVWPTRGVIHSEPHEVESVPLLEMVRDGFPGSDGLGVETYPMFAEFTRAVGPHSYAAALP